MNDNIITFKLSDDSLEQLNELTKQFQKEFPGIKITRSDIIRASIFELWQKKCLPYK